MSPPELPPASQAVANSRVEHGQDVMVALAQYVRLLPPVRFGIRLLTNFGCEAPREQAGDLLFVLLIRDLDGKPVGQLRVNDNVRV